MDSVIELVGVPCVRPQRAFLGQHFNKRRLSGMPYYEYLRSDAKGKPEADEKKDEFEPFDPGRENGSTPSTDTSQRSIQRN